MIIYQSHVQLTEDWGDTLFGALKKAGGHAYSNMAVGYNNVDVDAATRHGISVGNTPVCLTNETFLPFSHNSAGICKIAIELVKHLMRELACF